MRRMLAVLLSAACLGPAGRVLGADEAAPGVAGSPESVRPLLIGSEVPPGLSPMTPDGEVFDLGAALREGPTVLIIYRGGW